MTPDPTTAETRIHRLRDAMTARGVDRVLLSIGPDMPYLIGDEAMESERLTMLVIGHDGEPTLVIPELEAPRVESSSVEVRAWGETDDPLGMVAEMCDNGDTVALGDHTWSRFALALQERLDARWVPASPLMSILRIRKDPEELDLLRKGGQIADRVADRLATHPFSGSTERDVARWIEAALIEEGSDQWAFSIVASGPNAASPHHEPGDRAIGDGDMVVCDFGGTVGGYHADTTRTFVVGDPDDTQKEVHALVRAAQEAARDTVQPGVSAAEVDQAARTVITDAGYGDYFIHRTGHGIGREVHEEPYIVEGNDTPLEPGMCFSIEPGIYLPDRFGVRIEDIVTVTDDGVESFNNSDHALRAVG